MRAPVPDLPARLLTLGCLLFSSACSPTEGAAPNTTEARTPDAPRVDPDAPPLRFASAREEIRDLIVAVTELGAEATKGERNDWFGRRRDTLERLRKAEPEVGREALRVFHERTDASQAQRMGLLDIAAHAAPEDARELLMELSATWGEDLGLRTKAVRLLGETSPAQAIEVLQQVKGISFTFFKSKDVVRHPLVARILNAYERQESSE